MNSIRLQSRYWVFTFSIVIFATSSCTIGLAQDDWSWAKTVVKRIDLSENREELHKLLQAAEPQIRDSISFLLLNMPQRDLDSLTADFVLTDVRLATEIRKSAKWKISDGLFLNDVLPYANVDETREPWRERLNSICQPVIADCNTPSEAAQRLNEKLFGEVKVKYSTKRNRANQSPSESIGQGLASCTGLSILLVDACRSVGVPARLAGIPSWPNKRGNHTWVEIWDGRWQFTGAAEPSAQGLNHSWFQSDAALAVKDSRLNAIYAVSFKKTDTVFPLVWSNDPDHPTYAVNVTDRYTQKTDEKNTEMIRVFVRVWNSDRSGRVVAPVSVVSAIDNVQQASGESRGDTADMNDMLSFYLKRKQQYVLQIGSGKQVTNHALTTTDGQQQTVEIELLETDQVKTLQSDQSVAGGESSDDRDK